MSFSEFLWDNFEVVNKHSIDHRKGAEVLLQIFNDISSLYEAFGRGMERIAGSSYKIITTEGSLSHAVSSLVTDCSNKAVQSKILVESMNNDLIDPFRELLKNQNDNIKKTTNEGKKVEKDMQTLTEKLEKSKARYYKACEECEQLTILIENKINQERSLRLKSKLFSTKREVEASLKQYKESLSASNAYKERYRNVMMKILEVYQKQEEVRLESMKDMLRKLVVYQTSYLRNLQYDVGNLAHVMESININWDIKKYIEDNTTGKINSLFEEFVLYKGSHSEFQNLGNIGVIYTIPINESDDSLVNKVKEWVEKSIRHHSEEEIKQIMFSILDKIWKGISLEPIEKILYKMLIRERLGRIIWCLILQAKKSKGNYSIPEVCYQNISEMFIEVLDECQRFCDTVTGKHILNFIQCFHKETHDPQSPKEFLQDTVSKHEIWTDPLFWEGIVCEAIDEEFILQNDYYMIDAEEEEDRVKRLKNIVFCQLGTYANIMIEFGVNINATEEMVSKYANRYELGKEAIETLNWEILKSRNGRLESEVVQELQKGKPKGMEEVDYKTAQVVDDLDEKEMIHQQVGCQQDMKRTEEVTDAEIHHLNKEKEIIQENVKLEEEKPEAESSSKVLIIDASNAGIHKKLSHQEQDQE